MKAFVISILLFLLICTSCAKRIEISDDEPLYPIQLGSEWGYINGKGQIVHMPHWFSAGEYSEGLAPVVTTYEKSVSGGIAQPGNHVQFINKQGKIILSPDCDYAYSFSEGLAVAGKDGRYGYIDKTGALVIGYRYNIAFDFADGIALIQAHPDFEDGLTGYFFINKNGKRIGDRNMGASSEFSNGLGPVHVGVFPDWKYGFIDREGNVAIEPQFDGAYAFSESTAAVEIDGEWGFIGLDGGLIIEPRFEDPGYFKDGLCNVKLDGQWGYIDTGGDFVVEPAYFQTWAFSEGMGKITIGPSSSQKNGYVNTKGEVVIEPLFNPANDFKNGLAWVALKGEYGYIDKQGKIIWRQSEWGTASDVMFSKD